jgi:ABC-type nickel/cobalt efflux system permease component RcnA
MRLAPLLAVLLASSLLAQGNPFIDGTPAPRSDSTSGADSDAEVSRGPLTRLAEWTAGTQRSLQRGISQAMRRASEDGFSKSLLLLLGVSLLYGMLHALGPGHRKTVLAGYFLGRRESPLRGVAAGALLAAAHAGSAVVLVWGLYAFAVSSMTVSVNRVENILLPATYAIVLLLGVWMLVEGLRCDGHSPGGGKTGLWGIVLSGLVPCPAAAAVMLFAVSSGSPWVGVMSVLAMSVGMGVVLGGIGLVGTLFRSRLSGLLDSGGRGASIERALHVVGGLVLLAFGGLMLAGPLLG